MTQFLSKTEAWPVDVVHHHNPHLIRGIRNKNKLNIYYYNPSFENHFPWDKTRDLGLAYKASSQAERDINLCKFEITNQLKLYHALVNTMPVHKSQT